MPGVRTSIPQMNPNTKVTSLGRVTNCAVTLYAQNTVTTRAELLEHLEHLLEDCSNHLIGDALYQAVSNCVEEHAGWAHKLKTIWLLSSSRAWARAVVRPWQINPG